MYGVAWRKRTVLYGFVHARIKTFLQNSTQRHYSDEQFLQTQTNFVEDTTGNFLITEVVFFMVLCLRNSVIEIRALMEIRGVMR